MATKGEKQSFARHRRIPSKRRSVDHRRATEPCSNGSRHPIHTDYGVAGACVLPDGLAALFITQLPAPFTSSMYVA